MLQPSVLTTRGMGEPPGFSLYLTTTAKLKSFEEVFEEKMRWLQEVLDDAKRQFGREEVTDFPKTPAMRRKRQRIRRVSTIHEDDTENRLPVKGKRSSRLSISGRVRKCKEPTVPLRRSARNSARTNTTRQSNRSSSRTSNKVQLNVSNIASIQEASSSDTSSSEDADILKMVTADEPKINVHSGVITTPEVQMATEQCMQAASTQAGTVTQKLEVNICSESSKRATKRSMTSKLSQGSKKLRLNSGECVSTVSDDTSSSECDSDNKPSDEKLDLQQSKSKLSAYRPKLDEQKDEARIQPSKPKHQNKDRSRYKDHVKRLISHHELLIADAAFPSSDEEFQSPKSKQATVQKVKQPADKNLQKNLDEEIKKKNAEKLQEPVQDQVKDRALISSTDRQPEIKAQEKTAKNSEKSSSFETGSDEESSDKMTESQPPQESVIGPVSEENRKLSDIAPDLEESIIDDDSLEQRSITEDSLNKVKTPEMTTKQQKDVQCSSDQTNMTTDSLDQYNITEDSLDHNISNDSLNQPSSKRRATRQSLRKSVRHSSRRSYITVSHSKKRSSIYHHRQSVGKCLQKSVQNNHGTRPSTRASICASTCASMQASTIANISRGNTEESQEVTDDENQSIIKEEVSPNTHVEAQTSPPDRTSKNISVINHETQRITRAASRLADLKESLPAEQTTPEIMSNQQTPEAESESSSDDVVSKTPSPECPPNKVVRPRGTFFNSAKKEPRILNNLHGMVSSFIKRNTPQKQTAMERQQEIKRNIMNKQKREEENRRKVEAEKQKQRELQKRKREERIKKVTEARERHAALQDQKRKELEQRQQQMNELMSKQKEDKKLEETQRKQMLMKKKTEAEERRRQEEHARIVKMQAQEEEQRRLREMILRKKEYEEQERQRRIDEARRQQEQRQVEMERQRMEELQRRREAEMARERELQQLKEKRELERKLELERKREQERRAKEEAMEKEKRLEAERMAREREREQDQKHLAGLMQREQEYRELERRQQEQTEHERLKASILKHNTSACLNTTVNKDASPTCYVITPKRQPLPSTFDNYNIDNLDSGDSTDEEDAPRKKIPSWAGGTFLKAALIKQHYHPPPNLDMLFGAVIPPDLSIIFAQKKPRYFKRTSSAVWTSPLM